MKQLIEQINQKIAADELEEAIKLMKDFFEREKNSKACNDLVLQEQRLRQIRDEKIKGTKELPEVQRERRKVADILADIKEEMKVQYFNDHKEEVPVEFAPVDHESINCGHCLRENTTRFLLKTLFITRASVNLTGEPGTGKTRMLEDLQNCTLPDTRVLICNVKSHKHDYAALLDDIAGQLHLRGHFTALTDLITEVQQRIRTRLLLCLDNLDALNDYRTIDRLYSAEFVAALNNIKNRTDIRLVCTSRTKIRHLQFLKVNDELVTSPLDLKEEMLKPISHEHISLEIQRRLKNHWLPQKKREKMLLVDEVEKDLHPRYHLLNWLIENFEREGNSKMSNFEKVLKQWMEEYNNKFKR